MFQLSRQVVKVMNNKNNLRLLSFGKKFSNLITSVRSGLIGSEFSTFESRIKEGFLVVFTCDSKIWGTGLFGLQSYYYP